VPRRPYGHVPTRQSRLRPTVSRSQRSLSRPQSARRPRQRRTVGASRAHRRLRITSCRFGVTCRMARSARWVAQNCQFWYPSDGACDCPRTRSAGLISPFGRACLCRSPQRGLRAEGTLGWMPSGRRHSGAAPGVFESEGKRIPLTVFLMRGVDASRSGAGSRSGLEGFLVSWPVPGCREVARACRMRIVGSWTR